MKKKIGLFFIIFTYVIGDQIKNIEYLNCLIIFIFIWGIYLVFKSIFEIKILIIFILLYIYNYLNYSLFNKVLSAYVQYNNFKYLYKCGMLIYLFLAVFFLFLGVIQKNNIILRKYPSKAIEVINIFIVMYFIITGVEGKIGDYSKAYLTPKIEYLIIPYLCIYISSTKKMYILIINILYIILSMYLFMIGIRSPGIQLLMLILVLNKELLKKYRNNIGIIFILLGVFLMKLVGIWRSIQGNYMEIFSVILKLKENRKIVNNEADVIYAGTALIGLIENGILTLKDSLLSYLGLFFNFFKINIYSDYSTIAILIQKNTMTGGGGIISSNLYYLGREFMVIFVALFLGKVLRRVFLGNKTSNYITIYGIIVWVTVIRWFPYSINSLYKMSGYAIIWYLVIRIFFKNKLIK